MLCPSTLRPGKLTSIQSVQNKLSIKRHSCPVGINVYSIPKCLRLEYKFRNGISLILPISKPNESNNSGKYVESNVIILNFSDSSVCISYRHFQCRLLCTLFNNLQMFNLYI